MVWSWFRVKKVQNWVACFFSLMMHHSKFFMCYAYGANVPWNQLRITVEEVHGKNVLNRASCFFPGICYTTQKIFVSNSYGSNVSWNQVENAVEVAPGEKKCKNELRIYSLRFCTLLKISLYAILMEPMCPKISSRMLLRWIISENVQNWGVFFFTKVWYATQNFFVCNAERANVLWNQLRNAVELVHYEKVQNWAACSFCEIWSAI